MLSHPELLAFFERGLAQLWSGNRVPFALAKAGVLAPKSHRLQ